MSSFVLDAMPQLTNGTGPSPDKGGCVMQVVAYLWRKEWHDAPVCVLPVLRNFAISVNDNVEDEERQRLYRLIPRLMGTNPTEEWVDRSHAFLYLDEDGSIQEQYIKRMRPKQPESNMLDENIQKWINDDLIHKFGDDHLIYTVDNLELVLDRYDRITGRKAESCRVFDEDFAKEIKHALQFA